jgi:hypothetical protein
LKAAQAKHTQAVTTKDNADTSRTQAETVGIMGEVAEQTHRFHQEAHRVRTQGLAPLPEGSDANQSPANPIPAA